MAMTVLPEGEVGGCWPVVIGYEDGFRSVCGCGWVSVAYADEASAGGAAHLVGRVEEGDDEDPQVHGLAARSGP